MTVGELCARRARRLRVAARAVWPSGLPTLPRVKAAQEGCL